jgi:uncharacterized protein YegP (UPF0339 family)
MNNTQDSLKGAHHLRVSVELRPRSVRVVSLWVVDQPVIQRAQLTKPLIARIDLAGKPILLEAFDDPRIIRGIFKEGAGHSYIIENTGIVNISVPFTDVQQLSDLRIRMIDTSKVKFENTMATNILNIIDESPRSMQILGEIDFTTLVTNKDWPEVARHLGIQSEPGRFEIFRDRQRKYRWRLRRPDGEIVASSNQGFSDRDACEADIRWILTNAASTQVVSLDL